MFEIEIKQMIVKSIDCTFIFLVIPSKFLFCSFYLLYELH